MDAQLDELLDENQKTLSKNFASTSWLGNMSHIRHLLLWITYYRRNPHRYCEEYLGIHLHIYQTLLIYMMFKSRFGCFISARASAKSWLIAAYAVSKAGLYPNSKIVITSGVKEQARLMITEKIRGLMDQSPMLRNEIKDVYDSQNRMEVVFYNGSSILVVVCSDNALGHRSTVNVGEEAKRIRKDIMDRVISPFRIIRQVPFLARPEYKDEPRFKEEPTEIFISSSIEESHWLYKTAMLAFNGMINGNGSFFMATDYSITLKENIRTRQQMIDDYHKFDPITWAVEYENIVLKDRLHSYFTHELIKPCQVLERAFYPRRNEDVLNHVRNKYKVAKVDGEIRILAVDLAFIDKAGNDKSVYTVIRMLPQADERNAMSYTYQVPYIISEVGRPAKEQALVARRLMSSMDIDYLVLDLRSSGIATYDELSKVLWDGECGVEYGPLKAMNRDVLGKRPDNPNADPIIYCITATAAFNSNVAKCVKSLLINKNVSFLVPYDECRESIIKVNKDFDRIIDPEERFYWEGPYLETLFTISEMVNLQYEYGENTDVVKLREPSGGHKDHYSSLSYGLYFAVQLSRDLIDSEDSIELENAPVFVSNIEY